MQLSAPRRFSPVAIAERRGLHYGWVMVGVTFVILLVAAGIRSTPAVLIKPLEEDFGWSRSEISLALSLSLLTLGLSGPASGKMMERWGIRTTVLIFLILASVGVSLSITLGSLWQLHLFWGVLVGFGAGGMGIVLSAAVANMWFESRRGLITGLLGGASSAGQFVFLQALIRLVSSWGWRAAIVFLAVLLIGIVLPLAFWLIRSRPADVGLKAYGAGSAAAAVADTRTTSMREALRTSDFWLLSLSFAVCGFTTIGLIGTHFIPHATEHGFTETQAAGILSVMGLMNIVGTISSGWLTDRYSPRRLLAFYYFARAFSLLLLPMMTNMPMMAGFAILFGLDYIATVPPTVMLTANRFGRKSVPTIYGWITFSHMVGGAAAAFIAGVVRDSTGDYMVPIYFSGVLALVAAGMAFNVGTRVRSGPSGATFEPEPA